MTKTFSYTFDVGKDVVKISMNFDELHGLKICEPVLVIIKPNGHTSSQTYSSVMKMSSKIVEAGLASCVRVAELNHFESQLKEIFSIACNCADEFRSPNEDQLKRFETIQEEFNKSS